MQLPYEECSFEIYIIISERSFCWSSSKLKEENEKERKKQRKERSAVIFITVNAFRNILVVYFTDCFSDLD